MKLQANTSERLEASDAEPAESEPGRKPMSREELWQLVRQDIKVGWLWGIKRENLEPTSVVRIDATGYSSLPRSLAVYCGAVRVELTFARSAWVDELPHHRPTLVAEYAVAYQW